MRRMAQFQDRDSGPGCRFGGSLFLGLRLFALGNVGRDTAHVAVPDLGEAVDGRDVIVVPRSHVRQG